MTDYLFTSSQMVYDLSIVDNNTDDKLVKDSLVYVQDSIILQILGSRLYQTLQTELTAGTLTADNQTLIDNYIRKVHVAWVVYYMTLDLLVKYRNQSLMVNTSEYGAPVEFQLLLKAEERRKERAEFYSERLIQYLKANTDLYPDYELSTGKTDNIEPECTDYFNGFDLPDDGYYYNNGGCGCGGKCNCCN